MDHHVINSYVPCSYRTRNHETT